MEQSRKRARPGQPLAAPVVRSHEDGAQSRLAADLARDLDGNFERFVGRYGDRLFAFALTLTGNRSEAEEIAQDAFVSAYQALVRYEPERRRTLALRAWLFTIALNKVRNRARRAPTLEIPEDFSAPTAAKDGPEASAERSEAVATVRRALDALQPRYRMPVVLRHIEGLSYDEIATVLGQPVGTAKANVHRGLAMLRAVEELDNLKTAEAIA